MVEDGLLNMLLCRTARRQQHEGVIIDDIAEERARRAQALEEDFPGSRNIPSTGLRVPEQTKSAEAQATSDAGECLAR